MNNKKIVISAFILVALVQLYVPATMIWDKEAVVRTGTDYKFKTAPIDPNDPFRGKYITLSYDENTVTVNNELDWTRGEIVYSTLTTDNDGFATVQSVSKTKPTDSKNFVKAKVGHISRDGSNILRIKYLFNRYYMEESKAYDAERTYRQSQRNTSKTTYALVSIKNGDAVLKDVRIDGISIREIVKANQQQNKE